MYCVKIAGLVCDLKTHISGSFTDMREERWLSFMRSGRCTLI